MNSTLSLNWSVCLSKTEFSNELLPGSEHRVGRDWNLTHHAESWSVCLSKTVVSFLVVVRLSVGHFVYFFPSWIKKYKCLSTPNIELEGTGI